MGGELRQGVARVAVVGVFGALPVLLVASLLILGGHAFAYDFHTAFRPAGQAILHGSTPYVEPGSMHVQRNDAFVYPALAGLLMTPLAAIGPGLGDWLAVGLNLGAILLTLRVLQVRDLRVYGAVMLSPAVTAAWHLGNVALPIALGFALVWRSRDRAVVAGALTAVLISVKLYVWPLGIWLLATRRYAASAYTVAIGLALNLVAWGVLGFDELGRYSALMRAVTRQEDHIGYSTVAMFTHLGIGRGDAYGLTALLVALVGAAGVSAGRRGLDGPALALAVATCLVASPILWLPYFSLLVVPLAITCPVYSPAWLALIPALLFPQVAPAGWQVGAVAALAAFQLRRPVGDALTGVSARGEPLRLTPQRL